MAVGTKKQVDWLEGRVVELLMKGEKLPSSTVLAIQLEYQFEFRIPFNLDQKYIILIRQIKKRVQKKYRERKAIAKRIAAGIFERYDMEEYSFLNDQQAVIERLAFRYIMNGCFDPVRKTELQTLATMLREMRLLTPALSHHF